MGVERGTTHPGVETIPLYSDDVILVTAAEDPFADRGAVDIKDLADRRLIMFNRGSSYSAVLYSRLRDAGGAALPAWVVADREIGRGWGRCGGVRAGWVPAEWAES